MKVLSLWLKFVSRLLKICNNTEMQFSGASKFFLGPTNENRAASLPYRPLHKAARLCCVKAMLLILISCCLLTHVIGFSFYIQYAEEPWFTYQTNYKLTNIPTYLKGTYPPLTFALFLPNYLPSSLTVCTVYFFTGPYYTACFFLTS